LLEKCADGGEVNEMELIFKQEDDEPGSRLEDTVCSLCARLKRAGEERFTLRHI